MIYSLRSCSYAFVVLLCLLWFNYFLSSQKKIPIDILLGDLGTFALLIINH